MKSMCRLFSSTALLFAGAGVFFYGFLFSAGSQPPYQNYQLSWSDEFDIDGLPDSKSWGYEEGCSVRNNELQYYAKSRLENARVENGFLIIEARREKMGNCDYTSANLVTTGKRSFKYGLFEIRAKIDIRSGSWPAWWWLPNSGGWPRGGEIDMMEFYRGKLLFNVMDGNKTWSSKTKEVASLGGSEWADDFHTWTWEWDSAKIDLWLDGTLMNHYLVSNADGTGPNGENPFRRPGYMLVNQAIGGNNGGDPSGTSFPVQYIVDYVRHYQPGKDTVPPEVVSVTASANGKITVIFSEGVEKNSAESLSAYSVNTSGIVLSKAELSGDGHTVIITATGFEVDGKHTLTVGDVTDRAAEPNTMVATGCAFTVVPESIKLAGTIIGSGSPYQGVEDVVYEKAIDGNISTFADCTGDPVWVGYDLGDEASFVITGFRYYPRDGYADRMNDKTFEVSDNGTEWETVYTVSSIPAEGSFTSASIPNTRPVRYVRYNGSGGYCNVCEVEFYGFAAGSSSAGMVDYKKGLRLNDAAFARRPFTVTLYSIDGRVVARWKECGGEGTAHLRSNVGAAFHNSKIAGGMAIAVVEDVRGRHLQFSVFCR